MPSHSLHHHGFPHALFALLALGLMGEAHASPTAFQNPATASWGGWSRNTPGTVYAGWDTFNNAIFDDTPDLGAFNTSTSFVVSNNAGAFLTSGGNIYSFSDVTDITSVLIPTSLAAGTYTVALQISVLGGDISDSSVLFNGVGFTSKTILATGSSSAPPVGGGSTGVDNEYLFVWENLSFPTTEFPITIDFNGLGTSMSLDAMSIDVGPAPVTPPPAPEPEQVPIPGATYWLGLALAGLGSRRSMGLASL